MGTGGWFPLGVGRSQKVWDFSMLLRTVHTFRSRIFHWVFSVHVGAWIETRESNTVDKSAYCMYIFVDNPKHLCHSASVETVLHTSPSASGLWAERLGSVTLARDGPALWSAAVRETPPSNSGIRQVPLAHRGTELSRVLPASTFNSRKWVTLRWEGNGFQHPYWNMHIVSIFLSPAYFYLGPWVVLTGDSAFWCAGLQ